MTINKKLKKPNLVIIIPARLRSVRLSKKKCLYYVSELKTSASKIRNELTN